MSQILRVIPDLVRNPIIYIIVLYWSAVGRKPKITIPERLPVYLSAIGRQQVDLLQAGSRRTILTFPVFLTFFCVIASAAKQSQLNKLYELYELYKLYELYELYELYKLFYLPKILFTAML